MRIFYATDCISAFYLIYKGTMEITVCRHFSVVRRPDVVDDVVLVEVMKTVHISVPQYVQHTPATVVFHCTAIRRIPVQISTKEIQI